MINNYCRTLDDPRHPRHPRPTWQRVAFWVAVIMLAGMWSAIALVTHEMKKTELIDEVYLIGRNSVFIQPINERIVYVQKRCK